MQAHPGVHARMLRDGWDKRPGVRIIFGRWCGLPQHAQHHMSIFSELRFCPQSTHTVASRMSPLHALLGQLNERVHDLTRHAVYRQEALGQLGREFDGIFFDTYSEYYEDMRCAGTCLIWALAFEGVAQLRNRCLQASVFAFKHMQCETSMPC